MKIINTAKNTVLADNAVVAESPMARVIGLLNKKELPAGGALVIRPCNSIHTFFMRFPIDVLFVDKNNRVVKALPHLAPFRLSAIYFNAEFVIELPVNTIHSSNTQSGDPLSLR